MNAVDLASLAGRIQTIAHARAVLGRSTELLREAYGHLGEIPEAEGLRDASRSMLDQVNAYAGQVYAAIGTADPDLQDEEISIYNASRAALALHQCNRALLQIEENAGATYWDFFGAVGEVLDTVDATVRALPGKITGSIGAGAAGAVTAFAAATWPYLLVAAAGVGAMIYFRPQLKVAL